MSHESDAGDELAGDETAGTGNDGDVDATPAADADPSSEPDTDTATGAGPETETVGETQTWGTPPGAPHPDTTTSAAESAPDAGSDTRSGAAATDTPPQPERDLWGLDYTPEHASMLVAYRHDIHKLRGRPHDAAADEFAGVTVNQPVPHGADADAALLSRTRGEPDQTVANHHSPRRLSLLTGAQATADRGAPGIESAVHDLATITDPAAAHEAWLDSDVAALFTESVYYPYTSAKYHVLLTAALCSNYRAGATFDDLWLVVDEPDADAVPHRTICATPALSLRVTCEPNGRPAASLGPQPARSFADVWSRLPAHPLATGDNRRAMILDAQLRRIRSWSAALQYIEDYSAVAGRLTDRGRSQGWLE